jgi:hypothetical protein
MGCISERFILKSRQVSGELGINIESGAAPIGFPESLRKMAEGAITNGEGQFSDIVAVSSRDICEYGLIVQK